MYWTDFIVGIIASFATVLVIELFIRLRAWMSVRRVIGDGLHGENLSGKIHEDKAYSARYSFLTMKIFLSQKSQSRGNWESTILLDKRNFLKGYGTFRYQGEIDQWGVQEIDIFPDSEAIFVSVETKNKEGSSKYIIRKSIGT